MKKKFGVVLLALLLTFALVGCGSKDTTADDLNEDGVVTDNEDIAADDNSNAEPGAGENRGDSHDDGTVKDDLDNLGEDVKDGVESTGDAIKDGVDNLIDDKDKTNE